MRTKFPEVTQPRDRLRLFVDGGYVIGRVVAGSAPVIIDQQIDFASREASQLDVEIEFDKALQLNPSPCHPISPTPLSGCRR